MFCTPDEMATESFFEMFLMELEEDLSDMTVLEAEAAYEEFKRHPRKEYDLWVERQGQGAVIPDHLLDRDCEAYFDEAAIDRVFKQRLNQFHQHGLRATLEKELALANPSLPNKPCKV